MGMVSNSSQPMRMGKKKFGRRKMGVGKISIFTVTVSPSKGGVTRGYYLEKVAYVSKWSSYKQLLSKGKNKTWVIGIQVPDI
jgi:hypothetical protein